MFDEEDKTETYILVGLVNGNPKGCRSGDRERLFPDYHVSVGNEEVTGNKMASMFSMLYFICSS